MFAEPIASPNSYYVGFLLVSHGCGDSPTRAVRVLIPESITTARAQPKPGWTLTVEHVPLETPITTEGGNEIAERVSAITWSGHLPAAQFDQFGILLRLPDQSGPLIFGHSNMRERTTMGAAPAMARRGTRGASAGVLRYARGLAIPIITSDQRRRLNSSKRKVLYDEN